MPRLLPLLTLAALPALAQNIAWQQVGGSLGVTTTSKGILGQGYETPLQTGSEYQIQGGFLVHPALVNHAPFQISPIPYIELPEGFGSKSIRLDSLFADLDGDALQFSHSAPNDAYTVSIATGNTLLITEKGGSSGSTTIDLTCSDGATSVTITIKMGSSLEVGIEHADRPRLSRDLSSRVPKVFAMRTEGSGNGSLASKTCADREECLGLEILIPSASQVSVSIFDQIGTPVISLSEEVDATALKLLSPTADGRRILPLSWNLRASNGQPVAPGVYLWKVKVRTAGGQILETIHRMGVKGR